MDSRSRVASRSCGRLPDPPVETRSSEGERLFRLLFEEALTHDDPAMVEAAVGSEFTLHSRGAAFTLTPEQLWHASQPIRTGFPDLRFVVEEVIGEGDRVAARLSFSGTHLGEWSGIAPTGRRVTVSEMFMCRIADGRFVDCWQEWDEHGLREQLRAEEPRGEGS